MAELMESSLRTSRMTRLDDESRLLNDRTARRQSRQTCPSPGPYISGAADLFNAEGKLTHEATAEFLGRFMQAFAAQIARYIETLSGSS
jgi:hypothetical protein